MRSTLFICRIWQVDDFNFGIEWNDGKIQTFCLSEVQKHCPCANCYDETTKKSFVHSSSLAPKVKATVIKNVGRYGLHIQFTSGCSKGIYHLKDLYHLQTSIN